jgi:hypothetical protein
MSDNFYYCEWHKIIPEDATYEVDVRPERHCSPCAEEGIDQIVTRDHLKNLGRGN